MHNNYYFLKHLSKALVDRLTDSKIVECFSQNKNELIISFLKNMDEYYIKAHLDPSFCCLYFPESFQRAKKNSVDLFPELINQSIVDVKQYLNERAFSLILKNGNKLLFKMHGNRSNIILYNQDDEVVKPFNSHLKKDFNLNINTLDRPIDQSKQAFLTSTSYTELFPTFGKVIKKHLLELDFEMLSKENQWEVLDEIFKQLNQSNFYLIENSHSLYLSLIHQKGIVKTYNEPIEAVNDFFITYISTQSLRNSKRQVLNRIDKVIKQSASYLKKATGKLQSLTNSTSYSQWADIIMANLHQIETGSTGVTLNNFYDNNEPIKIKLKKTLSPQKNAEVYYRKAKNQRKEIANIRDGLEAKEQLLKTYQLHHKKVEQFQDLKELRKYLKEHNLDNQETTQDQPVKPFNQIEYNDFSIYIGKNAKSNDKMLQGFSYKEDLWLHAKDVSGSHVIIKHQAGKNFPKDVIERAAQLAAYYSKRKTDSLCPVIVTPRKFVRKRKGDPAGAVVVDKEDVILVTPNNI